MKITGRNYKGEEVPFSVKDVLVAARSEEREGSVESAQAQANSALEAVGALLEILIGRKLIGIDEMRRICGYIPHGIKIEEE